MKRLSLNYERVDYPHDEGVSIDLVWSKIDMVLLDERGQIIKYIITLQWDLAVLINWFKENEDAIKLEYFPLHLSNKSLAQAVRDFYRLPNNDSTFEIHLDSIYEYRTKHDIGFGLRGTDVRNLIIGRKNENVTISYCDEHEDWEFIIDVTWFFNSLNEIDLND